MSLHLPVTCLLVLSLRGKAGSDSPATGYGHTIPKEAAPKDTTKRSDADLDTVEALDEEMAYEAAEREYAVAGGQVESLDDFVIDGIDSENPNWEMIGLEAFDEDLDEEAYRYANTKPHSALWNRARDTLEDAANLTLHAEELPAYLDSNEHRYGVWYKRFVESEKRDEVGWVRRELARLEEFTELDSKTKEDKLEAAKDHQALIAFVQEDRGDLDEVAFLEVAMNLSTAEEYESLSERR